MYGQKVSFIVSFGTACRHVEISNVIFQWFFVTDVPITSRVLSSRVQVMERKKKNCVVACAVMAMGISNYKKEKRRIWQKCWLSDTEKYCHMLHLRD